MKTLDVVGFPRQSVYMVVGKDGNLLIEQCEKSNQTKPVTSVLITGKENWLEDLGQYLIDCSRKLKEKHE